MNNLLKEWKHILQLDDWNIELIENCSPNDMLLKDVAGETEWNEVGKTAIIRIIDKKDYGKRIEPFDFEKTLVHELLHCKFCLLEESGNDLQDRLVHQYIENLAKIFIKMKRRNYEKNKMF